MYFGEPQRTGDQHKRIDRTLYTQKIQKAGHALPKYGENLGAASEHLDPLTVPPRFLVRV